MKREAIYKIFSNIPKLSTERLTLRQMLVSDVFDMYEYASRPEVTKYLLWNPHLSTSYTREYLEYLGSRYTLGDFFDWAVVENTSNKMIGTCGFTRFDFTNNSAEIGYVLNPSFRGRGIAAEAASEVIKFGFEQLHLHRIEAIYMIENTASRRVTEKLGMRFEGCRREAVYVHGEYKSVGVSSILLAEYALNK